MTFADKLSLARKQKKIRQTELGKLVGTSGDILGSMKEEKILPLSRWLPKLPMLSVLP